MIRRTGHQVAAPATEVMSSPARKALISPSRRARLISSGGSIVLENTISRTPVTRWTAAKRCGDDRTKCAEPIGGGRQKKFSPTWNSFSTSFTHFLSTMNMMT